MTRFSTPSDAGRCPPRSLDILAVGLEPFEATLRAELDTVRAGRGMFKAVRGEYGSGKTFFARWFEELARREGFATSEVQISETETPLHRLETVYRRLVEQLATIDCRTGALRSVIDGWFFTLEEEVMADGDVPASDAHGLLARTNALMEQRLAAITRIAPAFAACLRGYRQALASGDSGDRRRPDRLALGLAQRVSAYQAPCGDQGRNRPFWGAELPARPADGAAGFWLPRVGAGAGRSRNPAADAR